MSLFFGLGMEYIRGIWLTGSLGCQPMLFTAPWLMVPVGPRDSQISGGDIFDIGDRRASELMADFLEKTH